MKLRQIKFKGLKGHGGKDYILEPLTAITGQNRGGKTTVRDAIFLALSGFHPELPKTNAGVMSLAGGSALDVEAIFESGSAIVRNWSRNTKGAVAATSTVPDGFANFNPVQLNPTEFLAMGPTARLQFLVGLARPEALKALLADAFADDDNALDKIEAAATPIDGLTALEAAAVARRKAAKQEADRLTKALREHLARATANAPEIPSHLTGATIEGLTAEIANLLADVSRQRKELADARTVRENNVGAAVAQEELEKLKLAAVFTPELLDELARLNEARAKDNANRIHLENLEEAASRLEGMLIDPDTVERHRSELDIIVAAMAKEPFDFQDTDVDDLAKQVNEASNRIARLGAKKDLLEDRIRELTAEAEAFLAQECCPTCGAAGVAFRESYSAAFEAKKLDLGNEAAANNVAIHAADQELGTLEKTLNAATERRLADRRRLHLVTTLEKHDAAIKRLQETEKEIAEIRTEYPLENTDRRLEIEALRAAADRNAPRIKELTAQLWSIEGITVLTDGDIALLENEINAGEERAQALRADRELLEEAAHEARRVRVFIEEGDRLEAELETAKINVTKAEAEVENIRETSSKLLGEIWAPVTRTAERILRTTFPDSPDIKVESDGTDVGIVDGDGYRPFPALSGSEQAILSFALAIAIAHYSPVPIALLDEVSRLDGDARGNFFVACRNEVIEEKTLEQIVLFDHNPRGYVKAGFHTISVTR
jgi:DNA repair exonuclease SbcCD ATPase subunit